MPKQVAGLPCAQCGTAFDAPVKPRGSPQRYCSSACAKRDYAQRRHPLVNATGLPTSTVGAMHEMVVATDLMRRGYHVFRALSPSAPCDLAILKDTRLIRVEVRTGQRRLDGTITCHVQPKDIGRSDILAIVLNGENAVTYRPDLPSD